MNSFSVFAAAAFAACCAICGVANGALTYPGGSFGSIVGYFPLSNVTENLNIDKDLATMDTACDAADFAAAKSIYLNGGNSIKQVSPLIVRTLAGFSTVAGTKLATEPLYVLYKDYFNSPTYAHDIAMSALDGTLDFSPANMAKFTLAEQNSARGESAIKTAQFMNLWMYVIHEVTEAAQACNPGVLPGVDAEGLSVDEAWAFFVGSLDAASGLGVGTSLYAHGVKRCVETGTCVPGSTTRSLLNDQIMVNFGSAQLAAYRGDCVSLNIAVDNIVSRMTAQLIQGMIRYFYRADPAGGFASATPKRGKEWAEGWAFARAVLPQINKCNPKVAQAIIDNLDLKLAAPMKDGYVQLIKQVESTYGCLNIKCSWMGKQTGATYTPCADEVIPNGLVGYQFRSSVQQHLRMDLDANTLEAFADAKNFPAALNIYSNGANSNKDSVTKRTLKGFSTQADAKMSNESMFKLYKAYFGSGSYGDVLSTQAMNQVGPFAGKDSSMIAELVSKLPVYLNLWMYVIHELEDGLAQCKSSTALDPTEGVSSIDEAFAFYAGSEVGNPSPNDGYGGYLLWMSANKRCNDFGTCTTSPILGNRIAKVNAKIITEFSGAQTLMTTLNCLGLSERIENIKKLLTIPLIQATLTYLYKADPNSGFQQASGGVKGAKEWGEAYAFAVSIVPQVNKCNPTVAQYLMDNVNINAPAPMKNGYVSVSLALLSTLECMNIACSDVGTATYNTAIKCTNNYDLSALGQPNSQSTTTSCTSSLSSGDIAGIVIGTLIGVFIFVVIAYKSGVKVGKKSNPGAGIGGAGAANGHAGGGVPDYTPNKNGGAAPNGMNYSNGNGGYHPKQGEHIEVV